MSNQGRGSEPVGAGGTVGVGAEGTGVDDGDGGPRGRVVGAEGDGAAARPPLHLHRHHVTGAQRREVTHRTRIAPNLNKSRGKRKMENGGTGILTEVQATDQLDNRTMRANTVLK